LVGRFFKKEWKWIIGTILVVIGLITTLAVAQKKPLINIKPFQYTNTNQYFSVKEMDPEKGDFILQFQLEIHNVGKGIAKDITFLKNEVRGPRDQSIKPSEPIISSDLGPGAKIYPKLNLVIGVSPANFKRLPSGKIQLVHDISMIEFDIILKYSSDMFFIFNKEYQIDASYRISADSVVINRYETL